MTAARLKRTAAGCLTALVLGGAVAGCTKHEPGVDEPAREGLTIDVAGIEYTVFITRELNLAITPDQAYYDGPPAGKDSALFGVFMTACNPEDAGRALPATTDFVVEDNQGNEFEPVVLQEDNSFAYQPRELAPGDCIPEPGSVAEQGPTSASMLLFEFPLTNTENRPLELHISGPAGSGQSKTVELDL
ncbi:MAG: hypothetical protein M3356_01265 [Actinomycetota bacterium]|nr:hypothetical protein [Actinomycetota bacterium]